MKTILSFFFSLFLLSSFAQNIGTQITTANGLASDHTGKVFIDHTGNLWVGTQYGLSKKQGSHFVNYSTADGLPDDGILSITEDASGNLYIGTRHGAAKFDGTNFTTYDSLDEKYVTTILVTHDQHIWFGTKSNGIYVYDGNTWTHYQYPDDIKIFRVYDLFEDNNNTIYAGGFSGDDEINIFQNGTWRFLTTDTANSAKRVFYFAKDNNGTVWASGHNHQGGFFLKFIGTNNFITTHINYIPEIKPYYGDYKNEFLFDDINRIISFTSSGLLFYDLTTGQTSVINSYNYFPYQPISLAKENENLWIGTNNGGVVLITSLQNFKPHNFYEYLDINNWQARFNAMGDLFWNPMTGSCESYIPKDSLKSTLFLGNLWIGGLDSIDSLHLMGERYFPNTETWAGPLANNYNTYNYYNKYNRLWKISKAEIEYHQNHYNDAGYQMPEAIKNWPGNGNTTNGELPIMAPFADMNGNNIYEPDQGDYPLIRGDQAVYFIYNDAKVDTHANSGGLPLGLEIHAMAYAYNDTGSLANTFFINYQIINRSNIDYHDLYIGFFDDFDIGNFKDDYTGCDSTKNLFYGYNGDDDDDGAYGYGLHPPAQGFLFLNQTMTHFGYYPNTFEYNPDTAPEFYQMLKFQLPRYGININSNYIFELHSGHTEGEQGNTPHDGRGVGSTGPFTLNAGDYLCMDIAFPWARTDTGGAYQSLLDLLQDADEIQAFYNSQNYTCSLTQGVPQFVLPKTNILIYPNPTTGDLNIETHDIKNYQVKIYSMIGKQIFAGKNIKHLNISNYPEGIYLIKINSGKENITQKIILQ